MGAAPASAFVYWGLRAGGIARANLDGSGVNLHVVKRGDRVSNGSLVASGSYIYWVGAGHVARADRDGHHANRHYARLVGATCCINSLAADDGNLYLGQSGGVNDSAALIAKYAASSGFDRIVSEQNAQPPIWMAADDARLFWSGRDSVTEANLRDGSTSSRSIRSGAGIAVAGPYLYTVASGGNSSTITRVSLNNRSAPAEPVVTVPGDLKQGLAVYRGFIYWATSDGYVGRASTVGTDIQPHWLAAGGEPEAVIATADHETRRGLRSGKPGRIHEPVSPTSQEISVKLPDGRTLRFKSEGSDSIEYLKTRIEDLTGIPTREQRIVFNGKQLEDARSLADYNIQPDSTLYLIRCPRPCH